MNTGLQRYLGLYVIFILLFASGCSSTIPNDVNSHKESISAAKPAIKVKVKSPRHLHAIENCSQFIIHRHPIKKAEHVHGSKCDKRKQVISNAHSHVATKATGSARHVHPGGSKPHKHQK